MIYKTILSKIQNFVEKKFEGYPSCHDMSHVLRVVKNAKILLDMMNIVDEESTFIVTASALLHDVNDAKLCEDQCDLKSVLKSFNCQDYFINEIDLITRNIGWKYEGIRCASVEENVLFQIVNDADLLDAMGCIGVARCFAFAASQKNMLFGEEPFDNSTALGHFYTKLFKLKLKTKSGQTLGQIKMEKMCDFVSKLEDELAV
jgi:uncharacterized protein